MRRSFAWGFLLLTLTIVVTLAVTNLISRYISIFDYIPNETVQIVGKTIIEISAALIGFWSLILVFILRSIQSSKNGTITQIHKTNLKLASLVIRKEFEGKRRQKIIDSQIDLHKKWLGFLNELVVWTNGGIRGILVFGIVVIIFFIASILSSMAIMGMSMAQTKLSNEFVEFLGVHYSKMSLPLSMLFTGIIAMFVAMVLIVPEMPAFVSKTK